MFGTEETNVVWLYSIYTRGGKKFEDKVSRFDTILACDRQTDICDSTVRAISIVHAMHSIAPWKLLSVISHRWRHHNNRLLWVNWFFYSQRHRSSTAGARAPSGPTLVPPLFYCWTVQQLGTVFGHATGPARPGRINFCHKWLKKIQTKIATLATLAMITQPSQTYASHMDFVSFTVLMRLFRS